MSVYPYNPSAGRGVWRQEDDWGLLAGCQPGIRLSKGPRPQGMEWIVIGQDTQCLATEGERESVPNHPPVSH